MFRRRPMDAFRIVALFLIPASGSSLFPEASAAQEKTYTVEGSVVETSSGQGVPGVLLRLESGPETVTGTGGKYRFHGLPAGTHAVAIVTPSCSVQFASFDAAAASRVSLVFQVTPMGSPGVPVSSTPLPGSRVLNGREIEELHVTTFSQLLQRVSPGLIRSVPGQPGQQSRIVSRGVASALSPISPILVLDGVNMGPMDSSDMLDMIHPSDIAFLEVFRGASGGWSYGTGASGGVVRVTRKRGGESPAPDLDPRRCPIPGWG